MIYREVLLSITFALLVRPGTKLSDDQDGHRPSGRPAAGAQLDDGRTCRTSCGSRRPRTRTAPGWSRRAATTPPSRASSPPPGTVSTALETGIHDAENAQTRFVLVGRPARPAAPTGADKTSVVIWQRDDHPGGLRDLLREFAVRGVNLMLLQSRPTGAGHRQLLLRHRRRGPYLGPAGRRGPDGAQADLSQGAVPGFVPACGHRAWRMSAAPLPGTSDEEFVTASDWVARCQDGRF